MADSIALVEHIERLYTEAEQARTLTYRAAWTWMKTAIALGKALIEAKKEVPYGTWSDFVAENLSFNIRTAQNYMNAYRNRGRLKTKAVSFLTDLYALDSAPAHQVSGVLVDTVDANGKPCVVLVDDREEPDPPSYYDHEEPDPSAPWEEAEESTVAEPKREFETTDPQPIVIKLPATPEQERKFIDLTIRVGGLESLGDGPVTPIAAVLYALESTLEREGERT